MLLSGLHRVKQRAELSLAKHRSLAGHPRNARRLASFLPSYRYDEAHALGVDGAPDDVVKRRKAAFDALLAQYQTRYPKSLQETADVVNGLSDLQFTSAYRIPFQFRNLASKGLKIGSFVQSTSGVTITDLDGNKFYDLTGSYGVNLFGNDFYKDCIDQWCGHGQTTRPGSGFLPSGGSRECETAKTDIRYGRSFIPYVWYGGRHAGCAPGTLP